MELIVSIQSWVGGDVAISRRAGAASRPQHLHVIACENDTAHQIIYVFCRKKTSGTSASLEIAERTPALLRGSFWTVGPSTALIARNNKIFQRRSIFSLPAASGSAHRRAGPDQHRGCSAELITRSSCWLPPPVSHSVSTAEGCRYEAIDDGPDPLRPRDQLGRKLRLLEERGTRLFRESGDCDRFRFARLAACSWRTHDQTANRVNRNTAFQQGLG